MVALLVSVATSYLLEHLFNLIDCLNENVKNVYKTSDVYNKSLRSEPLTCRTHNRACSCCLYCVTREEGDGVMHKPAKGLALGRRPRRVVVLFILVHPHLRSPPGVPAGTQTHNTCSDGNDSAAGIPAGSSNDSVTHINHQRFQLL